MRSRCAILGVAAGLGAACARPDEGRSSGRPEAPSGAADGAAASTQAGASGEGARGASTQGAGASGAPPGMVAIPAGSFVQGHLPAEHADEAPPHRVEVAAFALDETLVTRGAFARFVAETGYVTSAERVGYGMIAREGMRDWEWRRAPGASWRRPFEEGTPGAEAFLRDDAPVVMASWFDAVAFCAHAGRRLPTEAEWEYAMRAGRERSRFPWGEGPRREDGRYGLNFWQGESHAENAREDGFLYVSPVRSFAPNAWGVYDPVGNVWQWTADVYDAKTYAQGGPPGEGPKRVLRGGSWWCGVCTCEGYGLHFRGKAEPGAPFNNNGFRCAKGPS